MKKGLCQTVVLVPAVLALWTPPVGAQLCQTQTLNEPVPEANARFGGSVDLAGSRLVVGASSATVG